MRTRSPVPEDRHFAAQRKFLVVDASLSGHRETTQEPTGAREGKEVYVSRRGLWSRIRQTRIFWGNLLNMFGKSEKSLENHVYFCFNVLAEKTTPKRSGDHSGVPGPV